MKNIPFIFLIALFPLVTLAHYGSDIFGHHMDMGYGFLGGGVFLLVFWIMVIIGIIYLVKHMLLDNKKNDEEDDRAMNILKERYAKGEITKEEFEQKKKELK